MYLVAWSEAINFDVLLCNPSWIIVCSVFKVVVAIQSNFVM